MNTDGADGASPPQLFMFRLGGGAGRPNIEERNAQSAGWIPEPAAHLESRSFHHPRKEIPCFQNFAT